MVAERNKTVIAKLLLHPSTSSHVVEGRQRDRTAAEHDFTTTWEFTRTFTVFGPALNTVSTYFHTYFHRNRGLSKLDFFFIMDYKNFNLVAVQ